MPSGYVFILCEGRECKEKGLYFPTADQKIRKCVPCRRKEDPLLRHCEKCGRLYNPNAGFHECPESESYPQDQGITEDVDFD